MTTGASLPMIMASEAVHGARQLSIQGGVEELSAHIGEVKNLGVKPSAQFFGG